MQERKEEDLQQVSNKSYEVGIDEVGRGAIFGPVFSAVIVLTEKNKITFTKNFRAFFRLWKRSILSQRNR